MFHIFQNIRVALKNIECDIVSILTPSGLHGENIIEVASYGKNIIVEKPMTLTVKDADKVIDECNKNIKLFVVKQNRFNLPIIKLKEAIENQKFGKLILATIRGDGQGTRVIMIRMHGEEHGNLMEVFYLIKPVII